MLKTYRKQIVISACAYIGHTVFGFSAGWVTPVIPKITKKTDILGDMNETQINMLASIIFLGAIVATPLGTMANAIGRKPTLILAASLSTVSYLCLALIKQLLWAILFRGVIGISTGTILSMNLVYLGEIGSTEIRGILLGTVGIFHSVGFLIAYSVGPFVSYEVFNFLGFGISLAHLSSNFYIPESPVFFLKKGRDKESKATFLYLNRKEDAEKLSEMKPDENAMTKVQWTKLFTVKCNRKALILTSTLFILQQLSGIGPLIAYSTMIFEIEESSIPPYIATIITGLVLLLSGIITPMFIERCGRKQLLLLSTIMCCISLALLSVYLNLDYYGSRVVDKIKWLPLCVAVVHFVAYSFGFGIIPEALVGEMFELDMRSPGTSIVLFANNFTGFLTTYAFGFLISRLGIHVLFIFFSAICGVAFVFTLLFIPETKGKSLLEVQKMLDQ